MATVPISRLSRAQLLVIAGAIAALLSLISALPGGVRLVLLGFFVIVAPGTAALSLLPPVERPLRLVLTPAIGISLVTLASTATVELGGWNPAAQLVVLVALTCAVALVRPRRRGADSSVADSSVHPDAGALR